MLGKSKAEIGLYDVSLLTSLPDFNSGNILTLPLLYVSGPNDLDDSSAGRDVIRRSILCFVLSLPVCSTNWQSTFSNYVVKSDCPTIPGFESVLTVTHSLLVSVTMFISGIRPVGI